MSFFGEDNEKKNDVLDSSKSENITDSEIITSKDMTVSEEHNMKMSVVATIKEIDRLYKEGILQYTEGIHRYNIEIEKLNNQIEVESKKNNEEERKLFKVESILEYECKVFETLHHTFTQKVDSLVELRDDYQDSLDENTYNKKFTRKEKELFSIIDDIEGKELLLLNQELEKINFSNNSRKQLDKLTVLMNDLKELKLEKNYFESTELQRMSYSNPQQLSLKNESSDIVDTEVMA